MENFEIEFDELFSSIPNPPADPANPPAPDPTDPPTDPPVDPQDPPPNPDPTPPTPDPTDTDLDENQVKSIYGLLTGLEILDDDKEFDGKPETLKTKLEDVKANMAKAVFQNLWDKLHPDFKPALEYALTEGADLKKYIATFGDSDEYDVENVNDQRRLLFNYYRQTTKQSDDFINRIIKKLEVDPEDLKAAALEAKEDLDTLKVERQKELLNEEKLRKEKEIKEYEAYVETVSKALEESDIEKSRQNKVKGLFFNPIKIDKQETTMFNYIINSIKNNPKHLVQLGDLISDYDPKKGIDLTRLEKKFTSTKNNSFRDALSNVAKANSGAPGKPPKEGDTRELLNIFFGK